MLTYKLIKRKYKLNDTNIADFFGYKNRLAFFTSTGKEFVIREIEIIYDIYTRGGVKAAADYVKTLKLPGAPEKGKRYKAGFTEFIDTVNHQQKKGKYRDPELGPRAERTKKYTPVKK